MQHEKSFIMGYQQLQDQMTYPQPNYQMFNHNFRQRTLDIKSKKTRTVFTKQQINELEKMFFSKRYLNTTDRTQLAKTLSLTENQIKVWFQNRRNKWKKDMALRFDKVPNVKLTYNPNKSTSTTSTNVTNTSQQKNCFQNNLTENLNLPLYDYSYNLYESSSSNDSIYSNNNNYQNFTTNLSPNTKTAFLDCCYGNTQLLFPSKQFSIN